VREEERMRRRKLLRDVRVSVSVVMKSGGEERVSKQRGWCRVGVGLGRVGLGGFGWIWVCDGDGMMGVAHGARPEGSRRAD
jgi:hypothetical protein